MTPMAYKETTMTENNFNNFLEKTFTPDNADLLLLLLNEKVVKKHSEGEVIQIHGRPATGKSMLVDAIADAYPANTLRIPSKAVELGKIPRHEWRLMLNLYKDLGKSILIIDGCCGRSDHGRLQDLKVRGYLVIVVTNIKPNPSLDTGFMEMEALVTERFGRDYLNDSKGVRKAVMHR